jgi:hypothetical protein
MSASFQVKRGGTTPSMGIRLAIQLDRPAGDGAVGIEVTGPEQVAEHGHRRRRTGLWHVAGVPGAADHRRNAEMIEGVGREKHNANTLRKSRCDDRVHAVARGDLFQSRRAALKLQVIRQGVLHGSTAPLLVYEAEIHQAVRIAVGVRIDPERVDQAGHGRGSPDSQCQAENRDGGKNRILAHHPECKTQIGGKNRQEAHIGSFRIPRYERLDVETAEKIRGRTGLWSGKRVRDTEGVRNPICAWFPQWIVPIPDTGPRYVFTPANLFEPQSVA